MGIGRIGRIGHMNRMRLAVLVPLLLVSAAFAQDKPRLPISASSKTLGYSPLWVASKLGFFDKQGLDVQLVLVNGADYRDCDFTAGIVRLTPGAKRYTVEVRY